MAAQIEREELLRLARLGAAARLSTLEAERTQILKNFPELARGKRGAAGAVNRGDAAPVRVRGRRRQMSAAERKAVSIRMKKYWAARRKQG
jgi:hypothetical protein